MCLFVEMSVHHCKLVENQLIFLNRPILTLFNIYNLYFSGKKQIICLSLLNKKI